MLLMMDERIIVSRYNSILPMRVTSSIKFQFERMMLYFSPFVVFFDL